jgi:hypothetical protein
VIHKVLPLVLVAFAGFAAAHVNSESARQSHQASTPTTPQSEIAALRDELARLTNRVNHLETEIKASNPEGEYKQMTIDSVRWTSSAEPGFTIFPGREHELEIGVPCRRVERLPTHAPLHAQGRSSILP